jgi:hypothetical protein
MSDDANEEVVAMLTGTLHPLESKDKMFVLEDGRTGALYVECHIKAGNY